MNTPAERWDDLIDRLDNEHLRGPGVCDCGDTWLPTPESVEASERIRREITALERLGERTVGHIVALVEAVLDGEQAKQRFYAGHPEERDRYNRELAEALAPVADLGSEEQGARADGAAGEEEQP